MIYIISLFIFGLDYITKWLALTNLTEHVPQSVFPFFNLYLTHNTGVSFSMFSARSELGTALLIGVALAICLAIIYMIRQEHNRINRIALAMILGGALGNVWDRIQYGSVIDFLDFHWQQYHFPSFNVADTAISIGAMLLIFEIIRRKK